MVTSSRVQRLFVETLLWVIASRCRVVAVTHPSRSSPPSPPILSSAPFRYKDFVLKLWMGLVVHDQHRQGISLGSLCICHPQRWVTKFLISFVHISRQVLGLQRSAWLTGKALGPLARWVTMPQWLPLPSHHLVPGCLPWQAGPPARFLPWLSLPGSVGTFSEFSGAAHSPSPSLCSQRTVSQAFLDCPMNCQGSVYPARAWGNACQLSASPQFGPDLMVFGRCFMIYSWGLWPLHCSLETECSLFFILLWVFCWVSKERNGIFFLNAFIVIFNGKLQLLMFFSTEKSLLGALEQIV